LSEKFFHIIGPNVVANSQMRLSGKMACAVPFSEHFVPSDNLYADCSWQPVKIGSSLLWDALPVYMLHDAVPMVNHRQVELNNT
jgi:hypothetical protein